METDEVVDVKAVIAGERHTIEFDDLPVEYTIHVVASTRTVQIMSNGVVIETLTESELFARAVVPGTGAPAGRAAGFAQ